MAAKGSDPSDSELQAAEGAQLRVLHASCSLEGDLHPNEDRVVVLEDMPGTLYGVMDGHGGAGAADFVVKNLKYEVSHSTHFDKSPALALKEAVKALDRNFLKWAKPRKDVSGSCVLLSMVRGRRVSIAWAGDCRAVSYDAGSQTVTQLTEDHCAANPNEAARLKAAGIRIVDGRVLGVMLPSRSLGDEDVRHSHPDGVISDCELRETIISAGASGISFLLLASDGVWDGFTSQEAAELIRDRLRARSKQSAQSAVTHLCNQARKRGTADDISAILVLF